MNKILSIFKNYSLLWAMVIGAIFNSYLFHLKPLLPINLFIMLTLSYTRIKPTDLKVRKIHWLMLAVQWALGIMSYLIIAPFNTVIALGVALIILTPTATAASVVTHILGGSVAFVTTMLLMGNIAIALFGPLLISWVNPNIATSYGETVLSILSQVSLLLFLPLAIVWGVRYLLPNWHDKLAKRSGDAFYVWAFNVMIVAATAVHSFRVNEELTWKFGILLALITLATTVGMYFIGGRLAKWNGEAVVNGRQGVGQKNTVFAIWLGISFLSPEVALIPTFYIIWQNVINSLEISAQKNKDSKNNE